MTESTTETELQAALQAATLAGHLIKGGVEPSLAARVAVLAGTAAPAGVAVDDPASAEAARAQGAAAGALQKAAGASRLAFE